MQATSEKQGEATNGGEGARYLTCAQSITKYGWPSEGRIRRWIFRAKNDPALRKIFIRVRRRILLKERLLDAYIA